MRELMAVTKALADESRIRVVMILRRRELCVCQITALLRLAPSTVSKHLAILEQARLVRKRKRGRWIYYRRTGTGAPGSAQRALRWLDNSLSDDRQVAEDKKRLRAILKLDPEVLCRRQRQS